MAQQEPKPVSTLLRSQLRCPNCSNLISSIHRHDFQTCGCGALAVDGGRDYLKVTASEEVMALFMDEDKQREIDCAIRISGEHNPASAAAALAVYKALWVASERGTAFASAKAVQMRTASVGNGRQMAYNSVSAYLKMFCEEGGPVERSNKGFKPLVELHERVDAP